LFFSSFATADPNELAEIRRAIRAKGAHWTAAESRVSRLNPDERRALLGEMTQEVQVAGPSEDILLPDAAPIAIDWRNKDGYNWITPIRDQQSCGSCVAFGSVATLESLARIETAQPDMDIDLSEMHLFNCGGGSCSYGWTNSSACYYLRNSGTPDEDCWPYVPYNMNCSNTCPDWQSRAVKITSYGSISGIEACQTYVAIAPILVAFEVYTDFYYYTGGIYEHTWGGLEGGHAVSIVGYDTSGDVDYWIVKNSWGASWGESGFFKIKMGECNIETRSSFWMSGAILPEGPDITVSLIPDATEIPRGGTLGLSASVTNNGSTVQTFLFATRATLPNGHKTGYLYGPISVNLNPGQTKSGHISHTVPATATVGQYIYHGYVGDYDVGIFDEDSFNFSVTP